VLGGEFGKIIELVRYIYNLFENTQPPALYGDSGGFTEMTLEATHVVLRPIVAGYTFDIDWNILVI
jgi:hypothetical protein